MILFALCAVRVPLSASLGLVSQSAATRGDPAVCAPSRTRRAVAPGHGKHRAMTYVPSPTDTPFDRLGGAERVRAIVESFYDAMSDLEPALAALHPCDAGGRVARASRDRFALFFIGWLGGPQDYVALHGHPRLRMRHGAVPVDDAMAAAWMRCMRAAFERQGVDAEETGLRTFLEAKLGELALFLRNRK
jgi:hemoglobin